MCTRLYTIGCITRYQARIALSAFAAGVCRAPELPIAPSDARMASVDVGGITDQQAQHPVVVRTTGRFGEKDVPVAWARSLEASGHSSGLAETTPRPDSQEMGALARECRDRIEAGNTDLVLPVVACHGTDRTIRASGHAPGESSDEGVGSRRTASRDRTATAGRWARAGAGDLQPRR